MNNNHIDAEEIRRLERFWIAYRYKARKVDEFWMQLWDLAFRYASLDSVFHRSENIVFGEDRQDFLNKFVDLTDKCKNGKKWRADKLKAHNAELTALLSSYHQNLVDNYRIDPDRLYEEVESRDLVLALGGGGGTAYAHIILFQMLEEADIHPKFIAGTSLGSIIACLRCMRSEFDIAEMMLRVPTVTEFLVCARPFFGGSRFGLPGLLTMKMPEYIMNLTAGLNKAPVPTFEDLDIPMACVATGITDKSLFSQKYKQDSFFHRLCMLGNKSKSTQNILNTSQQIVAEKNHLKEIVFGLDPLTRKMPVCDAAAFSSAVPGLFHVEPKHRKSVEILDEIFDAQSVWRCCDGGLVNNVPARVARQAVDSGVLKRKNAFVYAIDVFAPKANKNALFLPLEQIANANVVENMPYADLTERLNYLLSPINLSPSLDDMKTLGKKTRKAVAENFKMMTHSLKKLPPIERFEAMFKTF